MYDTIHFLINRLDVPHENIFDSITPYLSNVKVISSKNGQYIIGNVENMKVVIYERGISIQGSICKYYFGDNLHTLQRKDVIKSIEKLSDYLHIDISNAKVTRLDISANLIVKNIPNTYFKYLGEMPRLQRLLTSPDTLYYRNSLKTLVFYDKVKECKNSKVLNNKVDLLQDFSNILRYEIRFMKNINRQLNGDIKASTLSDRVLYSALAKRLYDDFKSISKINENSNIMIDGIQTIKEAKEALFAYLLQKTGDNTINEYVALLKENETFKHRVTYSQLKKQLNDTMQSVPNGDNSPIKEIEEQISNVALYAR